MTTRKTRVLHLIHWLTTGGIERWLLNMLQSVDRERYQLDIACKGANVGELAPLAETFGARVWHVPLDWTHVRYARQLRTLIRQEQYDIVHNHLTIYAGMPTLVAKWAHLPTIVSFHNTDYASDTIFHPLGRTLRDVYGKVSINLALQFADVITGCSEDVVRSIGEQYHGLPSKTQVLYYGVRVPEPLTADERALVRHELGCPEDAPLIVHVGRFAPQKNHAGLLEIAHRVIQHNPRTMFVLVGDGPLRPDIEANIRTEGLTANVRLLGIRQDVERILAAADIFLLPSLWEGFPIVSLEASASGLPIVSSNVPGLREAVVDGTTGLLLPVDHPDAFANALIRLIEDPSMRKGLGAAGRQRVVTNFSRHASALKLCAIYDHLTTARMANIPASIA